MLKEQQVFRKGIALTNYIMEKEKVSSSLLEELTLGFNA